MPRRSSRPMVGRRGRGRIHLGFGPGPGTAVKVAVAFWAGGYLLSLVGLGMMGLYSTGLLVLWGLVGLVETIVAALVGGWIYQEEPARRPAPRPTTPSI